MKMNVKWKQKERNTTEQEETLLDNDKQPWLSDIVPPTPPFL